jgi:glutamyl-tRNA reductase
VHEALLLATCNRVEVYAVATNVDDAAADIRGVLSDHAGCSLDGHLDVLESGSAAEHLFAVAAGLDSLVVGDAQIIGQLRTAYAQACSLVAVGTTLHSLAQHALRVGKRVRSEIGIGSTGSSLVSAALATGATALGTLQGTSALIIGAGSLAAVAADQLVGSGVADLVVANRTVANAQRLATRIDAAGTTARAVPLDAVPAEVAQVDIVVACAGPLGGVLDATAVSSRRTPLVVCDLAMPRAVESAVGHLDVITLINLKALSKQPSGSWCGATLDAARALVADEARRYLADQQAAAVAPTVVALRRRAAEVVDAEMRRLDDRLPLLPEDVRTELSATVHRVVEKLLHGPTVRLRQVAGGPAGSAYDQALRELFAQHVAPP